MLYVISDDVAQLFLNEEGNAAFVVDAACEVFANGLGALLKDTSNIQHLYIFITHYHIDHV